VRIRRTYFRHQYQVPRVTPSPNPLPQAGEGYFSLPIPFPLAG
jgi:hypothetical protein